LERSYQKTTRKLPENNVEEKILDMLKDNSRTSRSELSEQLQISRDLAKYYLDKLKKKGIIRHKGSDKGGEWEIC
jgi:predicted HTH transcriptional regulator